MELLRIHLGATPHGLSARQLEGIAAATHGFSGSDLSVLVRDALMEPVRALQRSTHFRQDAGGMWVACDARARGARQMTLLQVPAAQLATPVVTAQHFESVLPATRPSVGAEDRQRFDDFTRDFGSGA